MTPKRLALALDRTVTLQLFDLRAMNDVLVRHPRVHGAPALRAALAQTTGEGERTRANAEVDSNRWHDGPFARRDDHRRQAVLEAAGHAVLRVRRSDRRRQTLSVFASLSPHEWSITRTESG